MAYPGDGHVKGGFGKPEDKPCPGLCNNCGQDKCHNNKDKEIASLNQALKRAHEAMCEASLNLQSDLLGEGRNPVEILEEAIKDIEKTLGDV